MNIFVLDANPVTAARFHNDRHVVKMILESCQLMVIAHDLIDGRVPRGLALEPSHTRAHTNHPCAMWTRLSAANYLWLHKLAGALLGEYTARYGKVHSYAGTVRALGALPLGARPVHSYTTPHPQCMPDIYKVPGNPVAAYRAYYVGEKQHLATWYRGDDGKMPFWFKRTK